MTGVNGSCKKCGTIRLRPMWRANRGDYELSKKWAKNDVVKKMQRGDHEDELVVLVPMVETVRKTDSGWVQNGQNKNEVD